jgi:flagellar motor protein MotB
MSKQAPPEESGEKAPLWIISFADMISLLMAFFVMLQTMAAEHSNEFLSSGGSLVKDIAYEFRRQIDGFGMPDTFGRPSNNLHQTSYQNKFKLESSDNEVLNPAMNGEEENLRRLFTKLSDLSKTNISQFNGKGLIFEVTPITFSGEDLDLDKAAQKYVVQLASLLQQTDQMQNTLICIVGIGADLPSEQAQWTVSGLRAHAVASFLMSLLPERYHDNIYWWGAGPAMDGVRAEESPYILIAIDSPPPS